MGRKKKNTGDDRDGEPPVRRSSRSSTIQKREESIRKAEEEKAKKEAKKKAQEMEEEEADGWDEDMDWDEDQGAAGNPEDLMAGVDLDAILVQLRNQFPDLLDNPDALDAAGVLAVMNQMFVVPGLGLAGHGVGEAVIKEVKQEEPDEFEGLISGFDQLDRLDHSNALLNLEATDKDCKGADKKATSDCGRRMGSKVTKDHLEAADKDSGAVEKILKEDHGRFENGVDSDNVFGADETSGATENSVKLIQKHIWNPQPPEPVILPDGSEQKDFLIFDVPSEKPTTLDLVAWIQNLTGFLPPNAIKIQKGFSLVSGETPVHIVKFSTSESFGNFLEHLLNSQNPRTLNSGAELIYLTKNLSEDSIAMVSLMILIGREVQKSSGRVDKVITVGNMCLILKDGLGGDCELDMADLLSGHYLAMTRIAHSKLNQKARKRVRFVIGVMGFPRDILPM